MATEKTFEALLDSLRKLRDCVSMLELTAREDAPQTGSVMAVDAFSDGVNDALGWLEEALLSAEEAYRAVDQTTDVNGARRALAQTQELFRRVEQEFQHELMSYERLKQLVSFGRSRGGEWAAWVKSIRGGLEQCAGPMNEVSKSLLACWQDLIERASAVSLVVRATSAGQQMSGGGAGDSARLEGAG